MQFQSVAGAASTGFPERDAHGPNHRRCYRVAGTRREAPNLALRILACAVAAGFSRRRIRPRPLAPQRLDSIRDAGDLSGDAYVAAILRRRIYSTTEQFALVTVVPVVAFEAGDSRGKLSANGRGRARRPHAARFCAINIDCAAHGCANSVIVPPRSQNAEHYGVCPRRLSASFASVSPS